MAKHRRRTSYISIPGGIELHRAAAVVWGYDQAGKFVCRLEISGAGVAVYGGGKGTKFLGDLTWENLVKTLESR